MNVVEAIHIWLLIGTSFLSLTRNQYIVFSLQNIHIFFLHESILSSLHGFFISFYIHFYIYMERFCYHYMIFLISFYINFHIYMKRFCYHYMVFSYHFISIFTFTWKASVIIARFFLMKSSCYHYTVFSQQSFDLVDIKRSRC